MLDRLHPVIRPYAFDDDMIRLVRETGQPGFQCYPFTQQAVVAGRGSRIENEIHLDRVLMDGVPVYRRAGGGCSVFLDPGCLVVSAAFPAPGFLKIPLYFNRSTLWLMNGLESAGLNGIYQDGISDLVIRNQKIGGTCFQRFKNFASFSASILVTPDIGLMERYLLMPPRQPAYRKNRPHKAFVTTAAHHLPGIGVDEFARRLSDILNPRDLSL